MSRALQPGGDTTHFLCFSLPSSSRKSHSLFLPVCLSLGTDSFLLALPLCQGAPWGFGAGQA